jgi:hypothetical protein
VGERLGVSTGKAAADAGNKNVFGRGWIAPKYLEALLPSDAKIEVTRTGIYRTDFGIAFWNVAMN